MLKLLSNENMKIYPRLRTWILLGIICVAIVLVAVVLKSHEHVDPNWKQVLAAQDVKLAQQLSNPHLPHSALVQIKQRLLIDKYDIAHNINPALYTAWSFAAVSQNLSALLIAFIVVVAGDIVASEFSSGTIKMLLTQTITRTKVLVSKYIAALLFAFFMTASMLVVSIVVGGIVFGFHGAQVPEPYVTPAGGVAEMSASSFLLMHYGFLAVQVIVITTIAFMVSAIFRSSALAITISILSFLVGTTLVSALSSYSWVKYILFANTDLSQYVVAGPAIKGMTLGFSITMLVIYFVVMNALSWLIFVKRDVAAG